MESTLQMLEARNLIVARAAHVYCSTDKHGNRVCKKENFFHRVGRWILTAILIFFGLIALMILCCCIRRKRSKKNKEAQAVGYQG
ncbi:hypothetical protein BT63DRAFT_428394 [Microthyrium microscopicum]|uniref:Uncharacterized protein n=1 Tax=Microthyrium microscopicum TaxID=703497 RepID=A0A6A6U1B4_9PEZI|nr:hypothetical protein BT63DRAFT_428394 [Microthyrium microscopicum]